MSHPTHIAILGNSGSGKSTLARRLVEHLGDAALLDLDTVAWEPEQEAVPRAQAAARADVVTFCRDNPRWVVEGCYAGLIEATLEFSPTLVFLNPGLDQCLANCRARPWEPHKFASRSEQDEHLQFLLAWVRDYYTREGDMSLSGHRACFEAYTGPKVELTALPKPDRSLSPDFLTSLNGSPDSNKQKGTRT